MELREHSLERIAAAAELVAVAHAAVRARLEPGVSERELWDAALDALNAAGPAEDAVVDLMSGERTALVGEPPGARVVAAGEPVLFDLAPLRDGYWADSCATFCLGPPAASLRRRHDVVSAALDRGLRLARPGVTAGQLDGAIRSVLHDAGLECPHHTGHGVGRRAQQPPWLVPGDDTVLEEGMTIAIEPGAYTDGFGVRLEHLAVVEADGARPLTHHSLDLTI